MARQRIGELLVSAKVLSEEQLQKALATPRLEGQRLGSLLVQQGMVTETQLTQVLGQQLSVPWVSLYHIDFSRQLLNLVPHEVAEKYCLVPIFVRRVKKQDTLYVAMDDPTNEMALNEVAANAGLPVKPMIASPSDIRSAIRVYYGTPEVPSPSAVPPPVQPHGAVAAAASTGNTIAPSPVAPPKKPPPPESKNKHHTTTGDSPDAAPEIESREVSIPRPKRGGLPMMALTLLDGSTIHLPARRQSKAPDADPGANSPKQSVAPPVETAKAPSVPPASGPPPGTQIGETLTARDVIRALRAVNEGANAREILGEEVRWEPLFAALLSALLKKGAIADWDFIEALRALAKPTTPPPPA